MNEQAPECSCVSSAARDGINELLAKAVLSAFEVPHWYCCLERRQDIMIRWSRRRRMGLRAWALTYMKKPSRIAQETAMRMAERTGLIIGLDLGEHPRPVVVWGDGPAQKILNEIKLLERMR